MATCSVIASQSMKNTWTDAGNSGGQKALQDAIAMKGIVSK